MTVAELKLEPTLCHGLVEAIAASLRAQAEGKGVELVVARSSEDAVARTDRKLLSTIVIDLIGRAIESATRGAVHIDVLHGRADGRSSVEISVAGKAAAGTGQAQAATPQLGRSQELAAALGGTISVHFRAGEGSTYVLQIPGL